MSELKLRSQARPTEGNHQNLHKHSVCTQSARKFLFIKQIVGRKSVLRMSRRSLESAILDLICRSLFLPPHDVSRLIRWADCVDFICAFQTVPWKATTFEFNCANPVDVRMCFDDVWRGWKCKMREAETTARDDGKVPLEFVRT